MVNFGRNIPTKISGPPPEVIPNIPVRKKTETDLSIWIRTEISGIFGIMENTPYLSSHMKETKLNVTAIKYFTTIAVSEMM